jgi:hypothetical protein
MPDINGFELYQELQQKIKAEKKSYFREAI